MNKWDTRGMEVAKLAASWSKDPSTKVGSSIFDGKRVVSTGYNGPPSGVPDVPTDRDTKLRRTIHAEVNSILFARRTLEGCTLYVTHHPCGPCAAIIAQSGISRVVVPKENGLSANWDEDIAEAKWIFNQAGIKLESI